MVLPEGVEIDNSTQNEDVVISDRKRSYRIHGWHAHGTHKLTNFNFNITAKSQKQNKAFTKRILNIFWKENIS